MLYSSVVESLSLRSPLVIIDWKGYKGSESKVVLIRKRKRVEVINFKKRNSESSFW